MRVLAATAATAATSPPPAASLLVLLLTTLAVSSSIFPRTALAFSSAPPPLFAPRSPAFSAVATDAECGRQPVPTLFDAAGDGGWGGSRRRSSSWRRASISSSSSSSTAAYAATATADSAEGVDERIAECKALLNRAADSRDEDPEEVVGALEDLEKLMRTKCKSDPTAATELLDNLNGSWRLIFTTGTKKTQDRIQAKVNYFPIKAVQSFDTTTDPYGIENGIYLGDFAALKFGGYFDFDLVKRKLEFDFTTISILGFEITIKSSDAAKIGASTGLGSESNVANADRGKRPFFNWISADDDIATARGGGGGLALWGRV